MSNVPDSVSEIARTHQAVLEARGVRTTHGAFYTPIELVERLVDIALVPRLAHLKTTEFLPRVLDPSCGTGNFLVVSALRIAERLVELGMTEQEAIVNTVKRSIHGVDIDPDAVALCRSQIAALTNGLVSPDELAGHIKVGNPLLDRKNLDDFDCVIGNPPFLDQQSKRTTLSHAERRDIARSFGKRASAINTLTNPAAAFLLAATEMTGLNGVAVMVMPMSFLAARDTRGVREAIVDRGYAIDIWMTRELVFDAAVHVCAVMVDTSRRDQVRVFPEDREPVILDSKVLMERTWAFAPAILEGVPTFWINESDLLGFRCAITADFRDQYYGLVGHVADNPVPGDGEMRLITSGLIDPFTCRWGDRVSRFAKESFRHPVVRVADLPEPMRNWARTRVATKVLVATQTRTIEAVVDEDGTMLPSVPVISVIPGVDIDEWRVLAVLMSPVATVIAARRHLGAGLSSGAIKMSASDVGRLPAPMNEAVWAHGGEMARAIQKGESDDLDSFGRTMCRAYGLTDSEADAVMAWWSARIRHA